MEDEIKIRSTDVAEILTDLRDMLKEKNIRLENAEDKNETLRAGAASMRSTYHWAFTAVITLLTGASLYLLGAYREASKYNHELEKSVIAVAARTTILEERTTMIMCSIDEMKLILQRMETNQ